MALRAHRGVGTDGGWRRLGLLSVVLAGQLLLAGSSASSAAGQQVAAGAAMVRVPPVAHMEVEPLPAAAARTVSSSSEVAGAFRIQVRANHGWEIVVAAAPAYGGGGTLWVRAAGPDGAGEFRPIEPGAELAVASGGQGESVIRVDYRWEGAAGARTPLTPLTYTLASR